MRGVSVLLTGGSGDLGRTLGPRLVARGCSVLSLDPTASCVNGVEGVCGSILERATVSELVSSVELVVHIAAWHGYHAFTGSKSNEEFWDLNMTGTFNLLEACARHSKRKLIFISSTSIDEWPDIYGVTKLLGEELCRAYSVRHGMQILALRPRAFIPWWNTAVYASKVEWASWFARGAVHIDDVTSGVLAGCELIQGLDSSFFEVVELDGKHDFSESDRDAWRREGTVPFLVRRFPNFSETIQRATFLPDAPPTYRDLSKARELLGYNPMYGYEEMLRELCSP